MSIGCLVEPTTFTGYEPKHLAEDNQLAEHEVLRVKPLFFHQPSIASTYDSAEGIVTPPLDSDWNDEQIRALLASPLYLQEREANAERSQVYHSARENLMSSSSQDPISTGRPVALFSSKNRLNQETFSDRENFPLGHQEVFGINEPFCRFSNPVTSPKSLLDGNRDHLLSQARSELTKQECKVDSLGTCIRELHRKKLILSGWNWIVHIADMKNPEESKFDYRKKWSRERNTWRS